MIRFTQYLRPDGRQIPVDIQRPPEVEELAALVTSAGGRLEIEVLMTGDVSMEVVRDDTDGDVETVAIEICDNGPAAPEAVDQLVRDAARKLGVLQ